ncbi:stage II sporulation protein M [Methanolobus sp. ZRKC3]|uniref:stage II sporulation protein M n=1 Tax=Methanolobus sp. ZRKC3 TaxID=3125786 RepID=UPI00325258D2
MIEKKHQQFRIKRKDIFWSARNFGLAIFTAFVFSMLMYSVMLLASQPAHVDEAIVSTASAAVAKVEITAEYISPMWSVFIFNSIAVFSAVIVTALFTFIHPMMIEEIKLRSRYRTYAYLSILIEKTLMPVNRLLQRSVAFADRDFAAINVEEGKDTDSIWQYCGYEKADYHKFSYMLPYTVPVMVLLANGFLMGILLAFFTFNGAITGFQLFGMKGIAAGSLYNISYFFISIIPHGIIEIPTILLAAALGYRFAFIQTHEVKNEKLFLGDSIESAKQDVAHILGITKEYISSIYVWKMIALMILMLLIAAYIEMHLTLRIVESVMAILDSLVEKGLA